MTFKDIILELKNEHNFTWEEMSKESGLKKKTLESYGCGSKKNINYTTAMKLVDKMSVDFENIKKFIR